MKLHCNICRSSFKTDRLKLVTINGRDYLACKQHFKKEKSNEKSNTQTNQKRVSQ